MKKSCFKILEIQLLMLSTLHKHLRL